MRKLRNAPSGADGSVDGRLGAPAQGRQRSGAEPERLQQGWRGLRTTNHKRLNELSDLQTLPAGCGPVTCVLETSTCIESNDELLELELVSAALDRKLAVSYFHSSTLPHGGAMHGGWAVANMNTLRTSSASFFFSVGSNTCAGKDQQLDETCKIRNA